MKFSTFLLIIACAFAISSCDRLKDIRIEKRHYRNGYYVHVGDNKATEKTAQSIVPTEEKTAVAPFSSEEKTASVVEKNTQQKSVSKTEGNSADKKPIKKPLAALSKKAGPVFQQPVKQRISHFAKSLSAKGDGDENAIALFLLIILAIFLPPLAVILKDGFGLPFVLDLLFWLLGFGFVIFIASNGVIFLGIFGLIAIIYALLVVLDAV
jgi:uncharacterized membrane protein YqaE (UPF0057 family)